MDNEMSDKNKNKKGMKKKAISSTSVLVQLYSNRKVATKVDNMLDEGKTYEFICDFCKENGINISKASLSNYKKKREEAVETGKPLLQLLDKRAKDNVTYITDKEVESIKMPEDIDPDKGLESKGKGGSVTSMRKVDTVYNDLEFLDEVVGKGFKGLKAVPIVDVNVAMKAIELRARITNNQLSGLTIAGLRELKMRQQARESALIEVVMKYIPEDQLDALFEDMDEAEKNFYENLDLTEEDQRITEALTKSNINL